MNKVKNTYSSAIRLLSIVPLLLALFLIINKAIFIHSHYVIGVVYSHAHPFNKSEDNLPIKQHHHSAQENLLIQQVNSPTPLVQPLLVEAADFAITSIEIHICNAFQYSRFLTSTKGRAPPIF